MSYHSRTSFNNSSSIESGIGRMSINGSFSSTNSRSEAGSIGSAEGNLRKADLAYNHVQLATRPGECRIAQRKMDVKTNYFKISTPRKLQAHCYRIELSVKGRVGFEPVLKREKAEPLFWSLYQQRPQLFPRSINRILFDGVGCIYSMEKLNIAGGDMVISFPVEAPSTDANRGNQRGNKRPPPMAQCRIMAVPMIMTDNFFSNDESIRGETNKLLDLIITHEMRCPLIPKASRFVQNGHSLFKVPTTKEEKRNEVRCIGMGEEVWTGLHMAVKDSAEDHLYLNASTSSCIFFAPKLNLVDFYAEVVHGYTLLDDINTDNLTIDPRNVDKLAAILKGTKVLILKPDGTWKTKKFDKITSRPATALLFDCDGVEMSVAEYFVKIRQIRLKFPNLPCLEFYNKITRQRCFMPLELCSTNEEPRKFKGKLTPTQLNTFIKAAGMAPKEKKQLIEKLTAHDGSYLGNGSVMREWGVAVEREMVEIKQATVLRYPDMQWKDQVTRVNEVSAEYVINESDSKPRNLIEPSKKPLALVMVYVNGDGCAQLIDNSGRMRREEIGIKQKQIYERGYRPHTELMVSTLRSYGVDVMGPAYTFQYLLNEKGEVHAKGLKEIVQHWQNEIAAIGRKQQKEFMPLFMFVFPRKNEKLYSCVKYTCDVELGVLSQVVLKKTFEKFTGNAITCSSAQNVLLKVVAKAGGVACRVDGNQFKSLGKLTSSSEATLVLGIDVTHPSREERNGALERAGVNKENNRIANQTRGRHQQLPTARPNSSANFNGVSYYDCPRSVVSVVGNIDLNQTKWGVSSRVQRIGQEESVNLTEPFKARIEEFHRKTGVVPKHVVLYRDGIADSMFKKSLYEETQALENALESFSLSKDQVTITYIVAKKRHHTRFFASDPNEAVDLDGRIGCNPPPGLLVEKTITSRNSFDFFLQSHYGALGTAAPTHYTVLRDDWKPSPSFWQTVVFGHCFGNSRCTRPLSLPVPLHYAHFAAKRAKILFDHFRDFAAPMEYSESKEDLIREHMETQAITLNEKLSEIDSMFFA